MYPPYQKAAPEFKTLSKILGGPAKTPPIFGIVLHRLGQRCHARSMAAILPASLDATQFNEILRIHPSQSDLCAHTPPYAASSTFSTALCAPPKLSLHLAELTGSEARVPKSRFGTLTVPIRFANAVRKATPPAFDMWKGVNWTADPP